MQTHTPAKTTATSLAQLLGAAIRGDTSGASYYVVVNGSLEGCPDPPQGRGVAHDITGERVDFPLDDVIRALGARNPATSPCHIKVGFVFAHATGNPPSTSDLDKVELYRTAIETWYAQATDQRGSLDTKLDGCGIGTAGCPGEVSPQCQNPPDGGIYDAGGSDGSSDGPGPGGDSGTGGDAKAGDSATTPDGGGGGGGGGGCGCRAARGGAVPVAALLAFGFLWRGRRRGRPTAARPRDR